MSQIWGKGHADGVFVSTYVCDGSSNVGLDSTHGLSGSFGLNTGMSPFWRHRLLLNSDRQNLLALPWLQRSDSPVYLAIEQEPGALSLDKNER